MPRKLKHRQCCNVIQWRLTSYTLEHVCKRHLGPHSACLASPESDFPQSILACIPTCTALCAAKPTSLVNLRAKTTFVCGVMMQGADCSCCVLEGTAPLQGRATFVLSIQTKGSCQGFNTGISFGGQTAPAAAAAAVSFCLELWVNAERPSQEPTRLPATVRAISVYFLNSGCVSSFCASKSCKR